MCCNTRDATELLRLQHSGGRDPVHVGTLAANTVGGFPFGEVAPKAVAYLRVSTGEQSLGLDAQRARIEAYCEKHGLAIASSALPVAATTRTKATHRFIG